MDTSLLQGLALLETQDGAKTIRGPNGQDSFNLFNIKDFSGKGFRAYDKAEKSRDAYRVYGSREESIQDLVGLLERKYPQAYEALQTGDASTFAQALKEGGYATDPKYVNKLAGAIESARALSGNATRAVQDSVLAGENAMGQLVELRKAGWGDDIDEALKYGWKPEEIVQRIAGAEVEEARIAKQRRDNQGTVSRFTEGAKNAVSDAALSARQVFASGDEEQELRDEAARRRNDLDRRALSATTAGSLGELAPGLALNVGVAAVTGGASLPAQIAAQAGAGALIGAARPTIEEGERTKNVLTDALIGGATAGAVGGASKLASKVGTRDAAIIAERTSLARRLEAEGLPVNAATLTEGGKNVAERLSGSGAVQAFRDKADDVIAGKVADALGLSGYKGPIDTNMLNTARPAIKQALDDATDVTLTVPQSLKADLQGLLGTSNPLTAGVAEANVVKQAAANLAQAADNGTVVSGRQFQELMSELKDLARSQTASGAERQIAGKMVGKLHDTLEAAMTPQQAAVFKQANRQFANLRAAEKMVLASGDSGVVTPRQMLNSVKTGQFKSAFLKDEAPFQELGKTAAEALGPANGKGLGDLLGRTLGRGDAAFGAATVLDPTAGSTAFIGKKLAEKLLAKAVTSENPTLVRLLTGVGTKPMDPTMQKYIAAALTGGSAGALTAH